jgi:hypothetical protein
MVKLYSKNNILYIYIYILLFRNPFTTKIMHLGYEEKEKI